MKPGIHIFILSLYCFTPAFADQGADNDAAVIVPAGSVTVEQPWIRAGDKEAIMLPAYAVFRSNANLPWVLERVTARGFAMVMIHRIVLQDGEPRMALQDTLSIPPGETITMNRDGLHLMFMGPKKHYKDGDRIQVAFHFRDQKPLTMMVPVLQSAPPTSK